ncbi:Glutamyl-tRNA(Gln) amidotransferase subunit [Dirofilaria immitis]
MTVCIVQSQYYYYPQYYNPYYQYSYQLYQQLQYNYYPQFQYLYNIPPPQFPSLSTSAPSTTYRFGIFPDSFVNLNLLGSSGLSRGLLIGRGIGTLIQLIVGK